MEERGRTIPKREKASYYSNTDWFLGHGGERTEERAREREGGGRTFFQMRKDQEALKPGIIHGWTTERKFFQVMSLLIIIS